ncbi:MAG: CCA tRNA nucleotidyltransferase [Rhizobiales bacterium]|nr:CCA tRNA nucleotidyltransferase [Hyphomicrobiales bacterium]
MSGSAARQKNISPLLQGPAARVLALLDRDGEEARIVGGAVRNALLGLPRGEIDIATTATPDVVTRRATTDGLKAVPTGIDHGTVTVIVDGTPFEVTTLREDIETFGRKARVRFGRDWRRDAERRDFTMNALSLSPDGRVHDPVNGLPDLEARRVRFIGDAETRIREDYLRILRFFRFHAAYGAGAPDADDLGATIRQRAGLEQLSRERIRMELMKLVVASGAAETLTVMADAGILDRVLSAAPLVAHLARMDALEKALGLAPDPVRRLGALAVHVTDDAERFRERLRLANEETDRLDSMARGWWQVTEALPAHAARALLYRLGPDRYRDRVLFAWARSGVPSSDSAWASLFTLLERWEAPVFPLRAADFIARGVPKGPALGAALAAAEEAWITTDFPMDQAALDAIAEKTLASTVRG